MQISAAAAGIKPDAFWNFTLYEIWVVIEAWKLEQEAMGDMLKATAWHSAYLARVKRFPKYGNYMRKPKRPPLTASQAREFREGWAEKKAHFEALVNRLAQEGKI